MNCLDQAVCLFVLFVLLGLSTANEHGPNLHNFTEIESKYVQEFWNYNPRERVIPAGEGYQAGDNTKLGYQFLIPAAERLAGITYVGHAARLRMVLERARNGEQLRIGALGGSITAGHGVGGGDFVYLQHFMDWINAAMPPRPDFSSAGSDPSKNQDGEAGGQGQGEGGSARRLWESTDDSSGSGRLGEQRRRSLLLSGSTKHEFLNGAVPGTQSGYTSSCVANHLIPGADLVFVEFAVNDSPLSSWGDEDSSRRPLERLFRKLLRLPSQPAVVLVNMYAAGMSHGVYWLSAERDFQEFATYYSLPSVSLKAAVMTSPAAEVSQKVVFNGGHNHPGRGGHVVVTELLITMCLDLLQLNTIRMAGATAGAAGDASSGGVGDGASSAGLEDLEALAARPLPSPIFPGNFGAAIDTCYIEHQLQALVQTPIDGWEWTDEGRGKWGYVAREPGRTLRMKVSTLVGSGGADGTDQAPIVLQISYLQSYCGQGTAKLSCVAGCTCTRTRIDAYDTRQVSLAAITHTKVSQHPECVLEVTTDRPSKLSKLAALNVTTSAACARGAGGGSWGYDAGYKFKVIGLVVGEEPGASEGTVSFVRSNTADIQKRVHAFGRALGGGRGSGGGTAADGQRRALARRA